jgi:hypothetical protein
MHEWQMAGLMWRMNQRTDAERRHADEMVGRLMAGLTRRRTWVRGPRPRERSGRHQAEPRW